ncbi:MAG TPA: hypothetical protein VJ801_13205 [Polyangia bacterium]|nr:hypothetical protein [Polyangia bacterium]
MKLERSFSVGKGTALKFTGADGKAVSSPQTVLDKLYSSVAFNPLEFAGQEPPKQSATLRRIVGLDFSMLDTERARIYQEREAAGRVLTQAKARLAAMPEPAADVPDKEVSVAALMAEKEAADNVNFEHAAERAKLGKAVYETTGFIKLVEQRRRELKEAEDLYAASRKAENAAQETVAALAPDILIAPIIEKIKGAESINWAVRGKQERAKEQSNVSRMEGERLALTSAIEDIDAKKAKALSEAKWPINGLGFSEDGVTYRGLPFDQASQSERLRVSVAIGIALNPTLRVLLIRDASLLDKASMKMLYDLAEEHDVQLWIERVGDGDQGAVILEDGEIKQEKTT